MTDFASPLDRREWLRRTGGLALGAGALAQTLFAARPAHAADFKALVCVFLYGGNDSINTLIPTDATRHAQYSAVRQNLAIPRGSVLPLSGTKWGLHPSLASLLPIWEAGKLAPIFNLGPLHGPLSKAQYRSLASTHWRIPDNLFSHSHQQNLWESAASRSTARTGWGGRAAQLLTPGQPVISLAGSPRFGLAAHGASLVLPGPGSDFATVELLDESWRRTSTPASVRAATLRRLHESAPADPMTAAYVRQQREAFEISARMADLVKRQPGDSGTSSAVRSGFSKLIGSNGQIASSLGQQLFQIAKLIESNALVGHSRPIYFASLGGFDTHSGQVGNSPTTGTHADLLRTLGDALAAFHGALDNLGLGKAVTSFTQSDFGRTFKPNTSNGTDHAWGSHHFVLGGAVKGGQTYGAPPVMELRGPDDVGQEAWEQQGRFIPTTSVDQYAATLLNWFGVPDGQLDAVLPNLNNFNFKRNLGFV